MQKIRATAVVKKDGKLLMIHRFRDGQEYYVLPGGKVEAGETVEDAAIRELMEETSVAAKLGEKIYSLNDPEERNHQLFQCHYVSDEPQLQNDSVEQKYMNENNKYLPLWFDIGQLAWQVPHSSDTFVHAV